jgi:hypothetical protein
MSNPPPLTRRLAIALTAAVASTTIAIGATAAALLGWLRPTVTPAREVSPPPTAEPAPPSANFVASSHDEDRDHERARDRHRKHDDDHGEDDDD